MKGIKGMKLGLIGAAVAALAIIAGLAVAAQVSAQDETISISDGTAAPGGSGDVELEALGFGDPGLGAWTIDISYDTSVISVDDCAPEQGGVCNPEFGDGVIRITGASATGLEGDTLLGTITFTCADEEGESALTLSLEVVADATIGDPQDVDAAVSNGTFSCAEPTEAPTPTTGPAGPPDVGSGPGAGDSNTFGWIIGGLAAAGLAAVVGVGALRARRP
jgi:hypothetical protein